MPRLIKVFAMRTAKTLIRLAHADLSLRWAHSHFVGFVMRRLISGICFYDLRGQLSLIWSHDFEFEVKFSRVMASVFFVTSKYIMRTAAFS